MIQKDNNSNLTYKSLIEINYGIAKCSDMCEMTPKQSSYDSNIIINY